MNVFLGNLKCDACKPNEKDDYYRNPHNIFNKSQPVEDLLEFIERYENVIDKPVFFNPINNNDTETTNLEPLAYGQDLDTNPGFDKVQ